MFIVWIVGQRERAAARSALAKRQQAQAGDHQHRPAPMFKPATQRGRLVSRRPTGAAALPRAP